MAVTLTENQATSQKSLKTASKVVDKKVQEGYSADAYTDGFLDAKGWIQDLVDTVFTENSMDIRKYVGKVNKTQFMKRVNKGRIDMAKARQKSINQLVKETNKVPAKTKSKGKTSKKPNLYALKYAARKRGDMATYKKLDTKIKIQEGKY